VFYVFRELRDVLPALSHDQGNLGAAAERLTYLARRKAGALMMAPTRDDVRDWTEGQMGKPEGRLGFMLYV